MSYFPLASSDTPYGDYSFIAIRLVSCLPFRKLSHIFLQTIDDPDQTYGRSFLLQTDADMDMDMDTDFLNYA